MIAHDTLPALDSVELDSSSSTLIKNEIDTIINVVYIVKAVYTYQKQTYNNDSLLMSEAMFVLEKVTQINSFEIVAL